MGLSSCQWDSYGLSSAIDFSSGIGGDSFPITVFFYFMDRVQVPHG